MTNLTRTFTWKSTKDELPKESDVYLVITKSGCMTTLEYSDRHKAFNASDNSSEAAHQIQVLYWTPAEDLYVKEDEEDESIEE